MGAREDLYGSSIIFLVVTAVATALRAWVRIWKKTLGYDDYVLFLSFGLFAVYCAFQIVATLNGYGASVIEPGMNPLLAAKYFVMAELLYVISQYIAKVGVALMIFRIATSSSVLIRRFIIASLVCLTLLDGVVFFIFALQCYPLSVAWGEGTGTCLSAKVVVGGSYAHSALDILLTFAYTLFLPAALMWSLQTSKKTKILVCGLLGLGVVSTVVTIIRLKYVVLVGTATNTASPEAVTYLLAGTVYSVIDVGLVLTTASLAALKPLLGMLLSRWESAGSGHQANGGLDAFANHDDSFAMHKPKGPSMRLSEGGEGGAESDAGSQDVIFSPRLSQHGGILKGTRVEVRPSRGLAER